MNKINLPESATRKLNRILMKTKKHSPEMLVVSGIAGVVIGTVMACKATTKIDTILDNTKKDITKTKSYVDEHGYTEEYTEKDYKKDLTIMYTQCALKLVKLYGPAVITSALSITAILAGHNITRKRNIALAAAYATVDQGFKDYRSRVI